MRHIHLTNILRSMLLLMVTVTIFLTACLQGTVYKVESISMEPALPKDTYFTVVPTDINALQRGDIVVFIVPPREDEFHAKRLIGLPGETMEFRDNVLYINGEEIQESYVAESSMTRDLQITLDEDQFFVLGDNRMNSSDSRAHGPVRGDNIIGKTTITGWNRFLNLIESP